MYYVILNMVRFKPTWSRPVGALNPDCRKKTMVFCDSGGNMVAVRLWNTGRSIIILQDSLL